MKRIVFANQKGGAGKTTLCYLFGRYAHHRGTSIQYLDQDAQRSLSRILANHQTRGWVIPQATSPELLLVDTRGTNRSALGLTSADAILVPVNNAIGDLQVTIDYVLTYDASLLSRTIVIPNGYDHTPNGTMTSISKRAYSALTAAAGEHGFHVARPIWQEPLFQILSEGCPPAFFEFDPDTLATITNPTAFGNMRDRVAITFEPIFESVFNA